MTPPAPRRGTGGPSCRAVAPAPFAFGSDIKLVFACRSTRDGLALALLARALFAALAQTLEVLAEVAVPGRDDDGDGAVRSRLTREAYERARLLRVDVAEERHHLPLAPVDLRELLSAAEHADPARAAGGRAALHGYGAFVDRAALVLLVPRPLVRRRARCDLLLFH